MTHLLKLNMVGLRNLDALSAEPAKSLNLLFGENGSGKTSFLEGIYLLGMARSFRSTQVRPLIQSGQAECTIYGLLDSGLTIGISKFARDLQQIRLGGRKADNSADLARALPLQLLNSDTFGILEGGPGVRRRFLDWGVFHVEQGFYEGWRQVQKALQQRNALLKQGRAAELEPWTRELARHGELVNQNRQSYAAKLLPVLETVLARILPLQDLGLSYYRGWDESLPLGEALAEARQRDLRQGYTTVGPQRADIRIRVGAHPAADVLSRGQQKLLVGALKLAQGILLEKEGGRKCIYLIDDLPAELDRPNRQRLCEFLAQLECQVFLTCVERDALDGCWPPRAVSKVFHVKHGKISLCEN